MTMSRAGRQMIKVKEVTRQLPQGLVSGQILFIISNNDLGWKDRSVMSETGYHKQEIPVV